MLGPGAANQRPNTGKPTSSKIQVRIKPMAACMRSPENRTGDRSRS